jgi:putative tricarboxylic transport membrane protein
MTALAAGLYVTPASAWEPTRNVEFIVPAGTGGGADQMARMIQGIITKHNLMKQSVVGVNKAGGAGGEGFLDIKNSKGNPHKLVITLSNLFTTPLATGIPFSWKDMTPVAMLALDEFVLWVNADSPYKTVAELVTGHEGRPAGPVQDGRHGFQAGRPDHHRRAREGDRHQDHLRALQGRRRGRGPARRQACRHDGQQPDRGRGAVARRQGPPALRLRQQAACGKEKIAGDLSWSSIPTCKSQGLDIEYLMLRGIFMPASAPKDAVDYYVELFKKVRATPEWAQLMADGAFNQSFMTGPDYTKWVEAEEKRHRDLMKEAGFLATN